MPGPARNPEPIRTAPPLARLGASGPRKLFEPIANRHELVDEICERLSLGEPLAHICRDDPRMPDTQTLWDWEKADEQIAGAIARARYIGHHVIASDLLKTARGEPGYSTGDVARDKMLADVSLKLLARWDPRAYGEATQLRHADANGDKLDTAPLIGELLTMLGNSPEAQPAINVTPRVIEAPQPAAAAGYKPRAKRLIPPPAVDDLV